VLVLGLNLTDRFAQEDASSPNRSVRHEFPVYEMRPKRRGLGRTLRRRGRANARDAPGRRRGGARAARASVAVSDTPTLEDAVTTAIKPAPRPISTGAHELDAQAIACADVLSAAEIAV